MATVRFASASEKGATFAAELKTTVDAWFEERGKSKHANLNTWFRSLVMLVLFFGSFAWILLGNLPGLAMLGLCVLMGIGYAGLGFNVCHDAVHGAYFKSARWNERVGHLFDVIGASSYLWRLTHNRIHHTWTNVPGVDEDIDVSPQIRHSPGAPRKWYHRWQHLYAWPLYALATVNWVLAKDYQQIFAKRLGPYEPPKHPRKEVVKLFAFKLFYYAWTIALPLAVLDITVWQYLLGFLVVHVVAGLILGVVFQLAHVVEEARYPVPDADGVLSADFHAHQLLTTANFATGNRLLTWYVGGLNHQVEHHLFPRVCSTHYASLRPIVKALAQKHGLPHHEAPTFWSALASHYRTLRRLGRGQELDPAPA